MTDILYLNQCYKETLTLRSENWAQPTAYSSGKVFFFTPLLTALHSMEF